MLAASYWSLLAPAIEMAEDAGIYGDLVFIPVSIGFIAGALFVAGADLLLPYLVISRDIVGVYKTKSLKGLYSSNWAVEVHKINSKQGVVKNDEDKSSILVSRVSSIVLHEF